MASAVHAVLNLSAAAKVRPGISVGVDAGFATPRTFSAGAAARDARVQQLGRGVCTAVRGRQLARRCTCGLPQ